MIKKKKIGKIQIKFVPKHSYYKFFGQENFSIKPSKAGKSTTFPQSKHFLDVKTIELHLEAIYNKVKNEADSNELTFFRKILKKKMRIDLFWVDDYAVGFLPCLPLVARVRPATSRLVHTLRLTTFQTPPAPPPTHGSRPWAEHAMPVVCRWVFNYQLFRKKVISVVSAHFCGAPSMAEFKPPI